MKQLWQLFLHSLQNSCGKNVNRITFSLHHQDGNDKHLDCIISILQHNRVACITQRSQDGECGNQENIPQLRKGIS